MNSTLSGIGSKLYKTSSAANKAINEKMAIKIKDSRIYQENDPEVFIMNDNLISKNLQDLGSHINKYYNQNSKLNRKV